MKPKTITYQRLYPIGAFANERLGMEVELNEVDSPEAAFQYAKETIEQTHKALNPHLYAEYSFHESSQNENFSQEPSDPKQEAQQRMITAISGSSDLTVLESFRKPAKSQGGEIQEAFNKREKELQNH